MVIEYNKFYPVVTELHQKQYSPFAQCNLVTMIYWEYTVSRHM